MTETVGVKVARMDENVKSINEKLDKFLETQETHELRITKIETSQSNSKAFFAGAAFSFSCLGGLVVLLIQKAFHLNG